MYKTEHHYRDFLAGAVIGGSLGAVTALMMIGNGKDVQKKLLKKYRMYKSQIDRMGEKFHAIKAKARVKKKRTSRAKARVR